MRTADREYRPRKPIHIVPELFLVMATQNPIGAGKHYAFPVPRHSVVTAFFADQSVASLSVRAGASEYCILARR